MSQVHDLVVEKQKEEEIEDENMKIHQRKLSNPVVFIQIKINKDQTYNLNSLLPVKENMNFG